MTRAELDAIRELIRKKEGSAQECCDPCQYGEAGCATESALADEAEALLTEVDRLNAEAESRDLQDSADAAAREFMEDR